MKKSIFILAAMFIITSCAKDDLYEKGLYQGDAFVNEVSVHTGPVITVPPDANGDGNDTEELTDAIAAAEPGTVIKLLQGVYHVGYMEVYNFHGTITGAGTDKTTVLLKGPIDQKTQNDDNQTSSWWRIIGGDVTITDITFKTPDGFLSDDGMYYEAFGSDLFSMFIVNHFNDEYYYPYDPQKLLVKNCSFLGGTNPDMSKDVFWLTDHNTWIGFWVGVEYAWPTEGWDYPLTKGNFLFEDCTFDHFLNAIEGFSLGEEAIMTVDGCNMNNCLWPLFFTANYNSEIFITNNIFTNSQDGEIVIEDIDWAFLPNTTILPLKRCTYNITGNTFTGGNVSSIYLFDSWVVTGPEERLPMLFNIKNNNFRLNGSSRAITAFNSQNPVIRNNRFTGTCSTGILVDGSTTDMYGMEYLPEVFAKNAQIFGNNFSGLTSSEAAVVLGTRSMDCVVAGTGKENVIDNGINNKISGIKKKSGNHYSMPYFKPVRVQHQFMKP